MTFRHPRGLIGLGITAALLAALALALVPGAQATKGTDAKVTAPGTDTLLYKGGTSVALDPGTAQALTDLGISVAPVKPSHVTKTGRIRFPITFGVVDSTTLAGQVRHSGGLKLTKGDTTVYLTRFFIDIDDTPSLTGLVGVGAPGTARAELFTLDLSGLKVTAKGDRIALGGVVLKLSADAATALNGAFGAGAEPFAAGLTIGDAVVRATTATDLH